MDKRSNLAIVRNPLLAIPAMQALLAMPASPEKTKIAELFKQASADARVKAEKCWRTHKAPMAAYWKAAAVYMSHTSRAIRSGLAPVGRPVYTKPISEAELDDISNRITMDQLDELQRRLP